MSVLARPFDWLPRAAGYRAFWLGLPLLLYVWTLAGPFLFDDLVLVLETERYVAGESPRLDLFRFAPTEDDWRRLRDRGTYPWWSPESRRIDLFRPLAEWSFYLDVKLFGRHAAGHRLVSLGLFAIALVCIHRLYTVASGDSMRAGVAAFFFGISQTVTQPATFISNRSDLLVLIGSTLAACAYWQTAGPSDLDPPPRIRRPRFTVRNSLFFPALAFVLALLSKEIAVALAGVLVLHVLLARWRRRRQRTGSPALYAAQRCQGSPSWNPPIARGRTTIAFTISILAIIYLAYYMATRPWHLRLSDTTALAPDGAFAANALTSMSLCLAVWTIGFPISALLQAGNGQAGMVAFLVAVAGAAGMLIVGWNLRRFARADRAAPFFIIWAAVFLLPILMTSPETRLLCPATVGWAYLLAILLVPSRHGACAAPLWLRHWLLAANGAVSIACAIGTIVLSNGAERQARARLDAYLSTLRAPLQDGDTLIIARPQSPLEYICAGDRLEYMTGRRDLAFAFLTAPGIHADIEREDDHTLLVTATSSPLLDTPMHRLILGSDRTPELGRTYRLRDFIAEIAAVQDDGGVAAVRFRFRRRLTSRRLHFYPPALAEIARVGTATHTPPLDETEPNKRPP